MVLKHTWKIALLMCFIALLLCAGGCKKEEAETPTVYNDYSTYVFFGTDSRLTGEAWKAETSDDSENESFSDVIMLLSINNDNNDVRIISVYRDTMLDIAGDGSDFRKCNNAFAQGGPYGAIDMLERNLDLHIDGYITANFMTVADAIDMLGGVEVDVEDQETTADIKEKGRADVVSAANGYIDEMNRIYGLDTPHIEKAGLQTLTGIQAVGYSRVRYTAGGDMRRTERQHNILALTANKLKSADTSSQNKVLKQLYQEADTDLSEQELMDMFDLLVEYDMNSIEGFPFSMEATSDEEKGYMLVPCDLSSNVAELHNYLFNDSEYVPSKTVEEYSELITKETGLTSEDANEALLAH